MRATTTTPLATYPAAVPTTTGTTAAGRVRGAGPGHPHLERWVHGRRGKREKSGARCSTNALRPSWPSSVM